MTSTHIAWIKSPPIIKGLDHLGVRAPCENLYAQLVPGITNVTDRARYFSFYPWLIWAVERHAGRLKALPFFQILRRADCLYTLIAARHQARIEESKQLHGAMIGAITLFPALLRLADGERLRLTRYATTEAEPERYFKNKLGGLGQYYLGTLREAGVLVGDLRTGVKYTPERGLVLAQAFERGIDRERFFEVLESDNVKIDVLDELAAFCPCNLHGNEPEHSALTDLFFNRESVFSDESGISRRLTLTLLLDLTARLEGTDTGLSVDGYGADLFRACAYAGALPNGKAWTFDAPALEQHRRGWQQYQRFELFSVAVQGIFWAGLDELQEQGVELANSEAYRKWFVETFAVELERKGEESFADAVRRTADRLLPLGLWGESEHEIQLGWHIHNLTRVEDAAQQRREVLRTSVKLLLILAARKLELDSQELTVGLSPNYLAQYPVNFRSFEQHAQDGWRNFSMRELLGWLAVRWGIEAHLRVALRKLRYDSRDTFKIRPTDQGLVVTEAPVPSFTSPRLKQSLQMLYDLRALDPNAENGGIRLSAFGRQMLEECRDE
ncbi:MAG TPA: hypothetical protein VF553_20950 [Pyrinomonadaceae bacterium]|jgi:hypothetical protein